jgi:methylase of polypeptide subunit release factors
LQYILGTEFFGDLEIECKPGVLIPRFVGWSTFVKCVF